MGWGWARPDTRVMCAHTHRAGFNLWMRQKWGRVEDRAIPSCPPGPAHVTHPRPSWTHTPGLPGHTLVHKRGPKAPGGACEKQRPGK